MQFPKKKGNGFFLCFRPVVMNGLCGSANGGKGNSVVKYVKIGPTDGLVFPRIYPALPSSPLSPSEKDFAGHRKKKSHKRFLRAVKAIFLGTSLAKKIKKKKLGTKLKQYKGSDLLAKVENKLNPQKSCGKIDGKTVYTRSSARPSSSCANSWLNSTNSNIFPEWKNSFTSCNSTEFKKKQDEEQENGKGQHSSNTGLFLIIVTLLLLVFCGKIFAILCTSTWLFFIPNWNSGKKLLKSKVYSQPEGVEDKKKIIMEGILERNRSPAL